MRYSWYSNKCIFKSLEVRFVSRALYKRFSLPENIIALRCKANRGYNEMLIVFNKYVTMETAIVTRWTRNDRSGNETSPSVGCPEQVTKHVYHNTKHCWVCPRSGHGSCVNKPLEVHHDHIGQTVFLPARNTLSACEARERKSPDAPDHSDFWSLPWRQTSLYQLHESGEWTTVQSN